VNTLKNNEEENKEEEDQEEQEEEYSQEYYYKFDNPLVKEYGYVKITTLYLHSNFLLSRINPNIHSYATCSIILE
jgi:hypothetical protein